MLPTIKKNNQAFSGLYSSRLFAILCFFVCLSALASDSCERRFRVKFRAAAESMIIVPVTVNGLGPFDFLFDTGMGETVIDRKLAAELNLPHAGNTDLMTLQHSRAVSLVHAGSLAMGGATVHGIDLSVINHLTAPLFWVRGILGEDFLRNFDLLIDNRHHLIQFESGPRPFAGMLAGEHVPFSPYGLYRGELTHNRLVVLGRISGLGDKNLALQLDSGANLVVLFANLKKLTLVSPQRNYSVTGSFGSDTSFAAEMRSVHALQLGTRTLPDLTVIAPSPIPPMDVDGFLPTSLFQSIFISHSGRFAILNPEIRPTFAEQGR
jgi:predicted aspartyl protease